MTTKLNIENLADITGLDKRTVTKRLAELVPVEDTGNRGKYYDSRVALPILYQVGQANEGPTTLTEARTRKETALAIKTELEIEAIQRERVPVATVIALMESISSEIINIHRGIPDDAATRLSEELRDIPNRLKW